MMSNIDRNSRFFFPTEIIQELRYDRGKTVKGKNMSKDRRQVEKKTKQNNTSQPNVGEADEATENGGKMQKRKIANNFRE